MSRKKTVPNGVSVPFEFVSPPLVKATNGEDAQNEIEFDPNLIKLEVEDEMVLSTSPKPVEDFMSSQFSPSSPDSDEGSSDERTSKKLKIASPINGSLFNQNGSSTQNQQYVLIDGMFHHEIPSPYGIQSQDLSKRDSANRIRARIPAASGHQLDFQYVTEEDSRRNPLESQADVSTSEEENGHNPDPGSVDTEDEEDNIQSSSQEADIDCPLPNLLNETGKYGFKVILDDKEDTLKTPTWLMSKITKKLYTNMNKAIPFRVVLKKRYPRKGFFLRAMAVFKYPMFLRQNVVRCPNHLNPSDPTNVEFPYSEHVIRADHPRASYERSPSGRLSVLVPLGFPENRNEAVPVLLKFMCHNSCVGGISRRPLAVLLSLELNGEEVGRYTVDVRVCACPSRDVKTEENHVIAKGLNKRMSEYYEDRRGRKRPKKEMFEDENLYFLQVRGLKLYKFLQEMKTLYLKNHPEYAAQYPELPPDGLRTDVGESSQESPEKSEENGPSQTTSKHIQATTPQTPPSTSKIIAPFTASSLPQDAQKPYIFIMTTKSALKPESSDSIDSSSSVPASGIQGPLLAKPIFIKQEPSSSHCVSTPTGTNIQKALKIENPSGAKKVTKANILAAVSDAKPLIRTNSAPPSAAPLSSLIVKTSSFHGSPKVLTSEFISGKSKSHLAQLKPEKSKKTLVTKVSSSPNSKRPKGSLLKTALQKGSSSPNSLSSDENEKVMLAAEVLASNMGSNRLKYQSEN